MDRKIKKKKWTVRRISLIAVGVAFLSFVLYSFLFADNRSRLNVDREKITIANVKYGTFIDYIPRTGNIIPANTYFIDAVEGGNIREIYLESGTIVRKGDPIMRLANSQLELDVLTRESGLYEQINLGRQTKLNLEQNSLNLKQSLAEIDYQLSLLKPQYDRMKELFEKELVSQQEWEGVKENYEYQQRRRELTYASYQSDSAKTQVQLRSIDDSEFRMVRNLELVSEIRENLEITAPRDGQLTTSDWQIGQTVNRGTRIGQVDELNTYKVRVSIDELYLPRIDIGQKGTFPYDGNSYEVMITKVYPDINNGVFEVDMEFTAEVPGGIKRGQSVRIRLELGNSSQALLLPVGGFFKDTGGSWVYVVSGDGGKAEKREIKLGQRNPEYFEIISGLEEGDKVITSSYDNFGDNEVLIIKQ
ncbi:MAG TPA: efflux transporter periplasmic adaptor subunit [Cytophagales bacterium]|nr:efflux transporter periplasmic adaptor subunit [Cytophagales bacterium]HAA20579.1 efflux transporter periplasmic adaptor subunit [Cytophagales bacterium]HAP65169.1 efflux transporter periplasmic adaptor subunit [Cytophagales bacterium]